MLLCIVLCNLYVQWTVKIKKKDDWLLMIVWFFMYIYTGIQFFLKIQPYHPFLCHLYTLNCILSVIYTHWLPIYNTQALQIFFMNLYCFSNWQLHLHIFFFFFNLIGFKFISQFLFILYRKFVYSSSLRLYIFYWYYIHVSGVKYFVSFSFNCCCWILSKIIYIIK